MIYSGKKWVVLICAALEQDTYPRQNIKGINQVLKLKYQYLKSIVLMFLCLYVCLSVTHSLSISLSPSLCVLLFVVCFCFFCLFVFSLDWLCQILCPVRVAKWVVRCRSVAEPQSVASIVVLTGQMCCLSLL